MYESRKINITLSYYNYPNSYNEQQLLKIRKFIHKTVSFVEQN